MTDLFFLGFYPLAYVTLVLTMRRDSGRMLPANWPDRLVAGLGVAALCANFALDQIVKTVRANGAAVATNLACPVEDLVLLALVVGGTAPFRARPRLQGLALGLAPGAACLVIAVGDTFTLLQLSGAGTRTGMIRNDIAWPLAIRLMSGAMWMRASPSNLRLRSTVPGFLLPAL